ncbi:LytR/AlgR family response regulator transcription factor [Clostridium felsineum]|uniref:LytR/AlgR family response regulator transcription factor n=1 Tax=Clostridium felsineum TaxID=36839 RepID=UPI00098CC974|nr:LytTR family DNA-binding domain-containing protein [Clostridium felsineum]URZ00866.1 Transcriptional regulatory protein YpdB [Clostridium felsineum]
MSKIKCVLLGDEIKNLGELKFILKEYDDIEIIGAAKNDYFAMEFMKKLEPQAVFFDINNYDSNCIDVAKEIKKIDSAIAVVFITAYDKYAVSAFEAKVLDYILKPFDDIRMRKTIERLKEYVSIMRPIENRVLELLNGFKKVSKNYFVNKIPCENEGKIVLVDINDIYFCYIKNEKTYIKLNDNIYTTSNNLSEIEKKTRFFRAHRSYLVNVDKVFEIYSWFNGTYKLVMKDYIKSEVPVSRGNVRKLKEMINI